MKVSIDVKLFKNMLSKHFDLVSDSYETKLNADWKTYSNGYVDAGKVYPKQQKTEYLLSMLCVHPRPFRFWFNKHTSIILDSDNSTINPMDFCEHINDYHILSMRCCTQKYRLLIEDDCRVRLIITRMVVDLD